MAKKRLNGAHVGEGHLGREESHARRRGGDACAGKSDNSPSLLWN